jgi:hypothetical protein
MGHDYNEKVFHVHIPSFLHGVLVGAGSLFTIIMCSSSVTKRKGQCDTSTPLMNPLCQNENDSFYIK